MHITLKQAQTIIADKVSNGLFLVFEGINGCGKSTLIKSISQELQSANIVVTHEPGATLVGKDIRNIVLEKNGTSYHIDPTAELLLFAADRAQHIAEVIIPALQKGQLILCDRYYYSTICFQGFGRQLQHTTIETLNQIATNMLEPDLVVLLDVSAEEGLRRTNSRNPSGTITDTFETEKIEFHNRVREGYMNTAQHSETPFLILDANMPLLDVWQQIEPLVVTLAKR